jgi:predicted nuclease of predicted toxin-antitoxin system
VRFLVDENLSPLLADLLCAAGHDASHVRNLGMRGATDQAIMARAEEEQRVVVSADTDFGTLLAHSGAKLPSVLLVRRLVGRRAAEQVTIIVANLPAVSEDLDSGAVVVLTDDWVRTRCPSLPSATPGH